ncbi:MAG: hypothetical protein EBR82_10130 [Caulobacteraceae bacterium]|nr:hypothetical protein [Caulobacteraceae bacterium]
MAKLSETPSNNGKQQSPAETLINIIKQSPLTRLKLISYPRVMPFQAGSIKIEYDSDGVPTGYFFVDGANNRYGFPALLMPMEFYKETDTTKTFNSATHTWSTKRAPISSLFKRSPQ